MTPAAALALYAWADAQGFSMEPELDGTWSVRERYGIELALPVACYTLAAALQQATTHPAAPRPLPADV